MQLFRCDDCGAIREGKEGMLTMYVGNDIVRVSMADSNNGPHYCSIECAMKHVQAGVERLVAGRVKEKITGEKAGEKQGEGREEMVRKLAEIAKRGLAPRAWVDDQLVKLSRGETPSLTYSGNALTGGTGNTYIMPIDDVPGARLVLEGSKSGD